VTRIRLDWQVEAQSGTSSWNCEDNQGVTGFDLPPGIASLTISPECADKDALASTYIAPPPVQREAIAGQTITLGAMELVLQVDRCTDQPCICQ
jgi:hypothetical protein